MEVPQALPLLASVIPSAHLFADGQSSYPGFVSAAFSGCLCGAVHMGLNQDQVLGPFYVFPALSNLYSF